MFSRALRFWGCLIRALCYFENSHMDHAVEARKLEYDCHPTPKPREEGKPAEIVLCPYSNFSKSTINPFAMARGSLRAGLAAQPGLFHCQVWMAGLILGLFPERPKYSHIAGSVNWGVLCVGENESPTIWGPCLRAA